MTNQAKSIINQALELSSSERATVAEQILSSLEVSDLNIEAIWAKEADARVEAYDRGELETVSVAEVFSKYQK